METKSVVILQHVDMKPIFSFFFHLAIKQNEIFKVQCYVILNLPDYDSVEGHIAKENYIWPDILYNSGGVLPHLHININ